MTKAASSSPRRPDAIFPLFMLKEAEIRGITLARKPARIAVADRSCHTTVDPSNDAEVGMGLLKAIGVVLCGFVKSFETNASGSVGRTTVLSASTIGEEHHLSWDMRDPANVAFGGFAGGKPTYHAGLIYLLVCLLDPLPQQHEASQEVVQRWETLIRLQQSVYSLPASVRGWDLETQVQPAFVHPFIRPSIYAVADALYFSLAHFQFPPLGQQTRRLIRLSSTSVVPRGEALARSGWGMTFLTAAPPPAQASQNQIAPTINTQPAGPMLPCPNCQHNNPPSEEFCEDCGCHLLSPLSQGTLSPQASTGSAPTYLQHFTYVKELGRGGMGVVLHMQDPVLQRDVAIKSLTEMSFAAEFLREARYLAKLEHPSIPTIYEYRTGQGHPPYMVMRYIDGQPLDEYLAQAPGGRLSVEEAISIGLILCDVLTYLHSQSPPIIFRDLKPENIRVTPQGYLYLIDFGIARGFIQGKSDTTALGSLGYAAPEQFGKNAASTPRTDLYGLGALLHALLTGDDPSETPFRFRPLIAPPVSVPAPKELETLVLSLVALDPQDRPASASEVQQELQRIQNQIF